MKQTTRSPGKKLRAGRAEAGRSRRLFHGAWRAPCRLLLFFASLVAFLVVWRGEAAAAAPRPLRIGVLEEAGNPAHAAAREACFRALALLALPDAPPPQTETGLLFGVAGKEAENAAKILMARDDLDLILASGRENLLRLLDANNGRTRVLALTPECVPSALNGAVPKNVLLIPERFWTARLAALHTNTGFTRLGVIFDSKNDAGARLAPATLLAAFDAGARPETFEAFLFEDTTAADAAQCREAADSLFFDEIDALLLEGSACFAPDGENAEELLRVLRVRGVLPVSLADPHAARRGALLSPWEGESARIGRDMALIFRFSVVGSELANYFSKAEPVADLIPGGAAEYALNLDAAEAMGFDPSARLLAAARELARDARVNDDSQTGAAPKP